MKSRLSLWLALIFFGVIYAQMPVPRDFVMRSTAASSSTTTGLQSDVIIEIVTQGDSAVWLGTGRGLAVMRDSTSAVTFNTSTTITSGQSSPDLPEAAISAIAASGDTVIVAFASDTTANGDDQTKGDGVAINYTADDTSSVSWLYLAQPKDSTTDTTFG